MKIRVETPLDYGKLPPQNQELEKLVLGIVMTDMDAIIRLITILKPESFYRENHVIIWDHILKIHRDGRPTDTVNMVEYLRNSGLLDAVGGPFYIVQLVDNVQRISEVDKFALILKELQFKRDLISAQSKSIQMLYEDTTDVFDSLVDIRNATEQVINEIQTIQSKSFCDTVDETVLEMKQASQNGYKRGVPWCQGNMDSYTGGAQRSDLIILAARPSMGKSCLMLQCARKQAKNGIPVGIISIEMSAHSLVLRMLSQETHIDLERVSKGALKKSEWESVDNTTFSLREYPVHIEDMGGIGVTVMAAKAKAWAIKHGIQILYVDYLQLAEDDTGTSKNREQEVATISRGLKRIAKELNIPVVALAQLNRGLESRTDKRPQLSDLRESGGIEQDADMVIFLYRDAYYNKNSDDPTTEVIIAKYRNGKTGTVALEFNGETQTFTDKTFLS